MALAGNNFLIMAVLVFVALLLLFESLYLLWMGEHGPQARRLRHRMRVLSDQPDPEVRSRLLKERPGDGQGALNRLARAVPHLRGLERHIMQSGLSWTVPKVLAACAACAVLAWMLVVGLAHQAPLTGLIVAAVCAFAPIAVVDAARRGRLQRIER
jgi:tight adherence protein B